MKRVVRRIGVVATLALAAATLAACAEGARPDSMTISAGASAPLAPTDPNYKALRVIHVDGGSKTNPLWMSAVSSEDFQKALESSLRGIGLLADDPAQAKLEVTANLQSLQRPMAGLDLSVTSTVHYSAKTTAADPKIVFDDVVAATGTARFGEALLAVQRLQMANEASMRENIKVFIQRLRKALGQAETAPN
jgi:hypothetical protein